MPLSRVTPPIFTRYMAGRFFKPFVFGLALFSLLIFLGDMFDKMNYLIKSSAPLGVILVYLWLEVPYWTIRVFPMATLLATLVALTGFVQSGEWIAVQSCGLRTRDFWRPLLACAFAVALLAFAAQETILPVCYRRARRIWQDRIHPEWQWEIFSDISLIGAPGEFIETRLFVPAKGTLDRPVLERIGPSGVEYQLDAKGAAWDKAQGRWIFHDGVERTFTPNGMRQEPFKTKVSDLVVPPLSLIPRTQEPDEMSLRELRELLRRSAHLGISQRELRLAISNKLAYPFTNFVICALGIPIALRLRRSAKIISFCVALGLSFLYLWFMEIGRALGMGGGMPPVLAAWTANLVFGALAIYLIRQYDE